MPKSKTLARRVVPFQFKAAQDPATGAHTFEGLAAVWTLDLGNDVIQKGAFKKTLDAWRKGTDAIPLLNSHDHYDVMSALGQLIDAKETKDGLWTKWEVIPGPEGEALIQRMTPSKTTGRAVVGKMSIGYEPTKFSYTQPEGTSSFFDRVRNLEEVGLKEVSVVLFPMAPNANIDSSTVKSFMWQTKDVDPETLSVDTKLQLRKLASRIGMLLKKTPAAPKAVVQDGDGDDDEADQNETDEPKPKAKLPKKKPTATSPTPPASGKADDDEDLDDTDEDDLNAIGDADADDDEEEDLSDIGDESIDEDESDLSDAEGAEAQKGATGPAIYVYSEALQQRLQKAKLQHTISNISK